MPIYRFRFVDKFYQVIAGQWSDCDDDSAAREHADILAAQIDNLSIEIWNGGRQVPRKRPDASTAAKSTTR